MDVRDLIIAIRDGRTVPADAMRDVAGGIADGRVTDAQAGAFAMATLLKGLSTEARVALTEGMRDSGDVMRWDLPGPVLDKHSTGGIGDCVSLLLAPILAALGVFNPMISGRGLGHTGGTLDKLEAIPGLRTVVDETRLHEIVRQTGCAIVSATGNLAPADRRLYAIRDVTGTVESVDLITASILSKKLAAGLDALVLDVKVGTGAFMETPEDARVLARSLVSTANGAGCATSALITDMNEPLASAAGNAVEVAVCMDAFESPDPESRLVSVALDLIADLLVLAGVYEHVDVARAAAFQVLQDGSAADRFGRMVSDLGGPRDFMESWRTHLPRSPVRVDVPSVADGRVQSINGRAIGNTVVRLGGGRLRDGDQIDPAVGLTELVPIGASVSAGDPVAVVHAANYDAAHLAVDAVQAAYRVGSEPVEQGALVLDRLRP